MYLTISWTAPRHHQNGSVMVIIVYRTLRYTFLWNMNNIISIHYEYTCENIFCNMLAISFMGLCVDSLTPSDAFMRQCIRWSLVQIMTCRRFGAIIWTNADISSIRPQGTHFNETLFVIQQFPLKKMPLNMSSAKWRQFCLGFVLNQPANNL